MYPLVINSIVEPEETISLVMAIGLMWRDDQLTWDPVLYGNISSLTITTEDIWLPYVYLWNSVDSLRPMAEHSKFYTEVEFLGDMFWIPGDIFRAKCPINLHKFPFDTQTCNFYFSVWGAYEEVKYSHVSGNTTLHYYTANSDWNIIHQMQYVENISSIPRFVFQVSIKRQSLYHVVMVILPTFLFSLMNPLVFLLPVESGERISLGMTILLSYAIFLTLISNSIPATSNPICALLLLMIIIMMLSGLIVICLILTVHIYYKEEDGGGDRSLVYRVVANCCSRNSTKSNMSWKYVSRILDGFLIVVSYLSLIVIFAGYFIYVFLDLNSRHLRGFWKEPPSYIP